MQIDKNHLKGAAIASLGVMTLLLIGSFVFFKERMFTDAAMIAFQVIDNGTLQIQCERYGSFITQMVPVIAVKLHWPLKELLVAYSASFNLFYLGTAILLFFRFKNYALVVLIGLYYTLHVSQTYYWTNNELQQGVCWMFLMYGTLLHLSAKSERTGKRIDQINSLLYFAVLAFIAIFTHPGVIFPLMFLWVFYWLDGKQAPFNSRKVFIYTAIVLAIFAFKYFHSTTNWYDSQLTSNLLKSSPVDVLNAFTSGTADRFWKSISHTNWTLPIIFIASLVYLIREKKYFLLSYLVVANLAYFVILCITFKAEVDFYIESEFMPFTIFGASVFVYYMLPLIQKRQTVTALLAVIFLVRAAYILNASKGFTKRCNRLDEALAYMKKEHINKMVLLRENDDFEKEIINTCWGLPYETMFHSVLNGDSVTATFLNINQNAMKSMPLPDSLKDMRTDFGPISRNSLNKEYFTFDTVQPYVIRTYQEVFRH